MASPTTTVAALFGGLTTNRRRFYASSTAVRLFANLTATPKAKLLVAKVTLATLRVPKLASTTTTELALTTAAVDDEEDFYDDDLLYQTAADDGEISSFSWFAEENAPWLWTLTVLYALNLLAVILFNSVTLAGLISRRNKRQSLVTNPYVACLLVTNVLWPIINIPFLFVQTWTPYWQFGRIVCKFLPVVQMCFPNAISLTLCLIAIERYLSIIHPFHANPLLKRSVAITLIVLTWLIPLVVNSILAITHDLIYLDDGKSACGALSALEAHDEEGHEMAESENDSDSSGVTQIVPLIKVSHAFLENFKVLQAVVVLLVIPGILFPFCYGQIIVKVFAMKSSVKQSTKLSNTLTLQNSSDSHLATLAAVTNRKLERAERRRKSVTLLSIAIQVVHFTCWTPIVVFQLWHLLTGYPQLTPAGYILHRFFILLASTNPALNSLLYAAALRREKSAISRPSYQNNRGATRSTIISTSSPRPTATESGQAANPLLQVPQQQATRAPLNSVDEEAVFETPLDKTDHAILRGGATTFIFAKLTQFTGAKAFQNFRKITMLRKNPSSVSLKTPANPQVLSTIGERSSEAPKASPYKTPSKLRQAKSELEGLTKHSLDEDLTVVSVSFDDEGLAVPASIARLARRKSSSYAEKCQKACKKPSSLASSATNQDDNLSSYYSLAPETLPGQSMPNRCDSIIGEAVKHFFTTDQPLDLRIGARDNSLAADGAGDDSSLGQTQIISI